MRSSERSRPGRERAGTILYLITNDISARFLRGQLAFLVDHGFRVEVGTGRSNPPAAFDDGIDVHDLPFVREPSPIADLRSLWATVRLVRRVRPAVVNASTPKAGLIGMLAARLCRVPTRVYVVRGLRFETMHGWRRRLMVGLERLTTACATDVVYNSTSLLARAQELGAVRPGRGVVLAGGSGNGIDVRRFDDLPSRAAARADLGIPDDASVVGFVGRLTRDKGIVDLVTALGELGSVTLLLVGDVEEGDPVPDDVRREIEQSPRIVHVPWVDDPRRVYPAMDVLAFPSYREGLPNVPLEAQLCGVPVVAYAATGTVDAVAEGAGNSLVDVGDRGAFVEALASRVDGGAHDPAPARHWVTERFDRERVWTELLAVIRGRGDRGLRADPRPGDDAAV